MNTLRAMLLMASVLVAMFSLGCSTDADTKQINSMQVTISTEANPGTENQTRMTYSITLKNQTGQPLDIEMAETKLSDPIAKKAINKTGLMKPVHAVIDADQEFTLDGIVIVDNTGLSFGEINSSEAVDSVNLTLTTGEVINVPV